MYFSIRNIHLKICKMINLPPLYWQPEFFIHTEANEPGNVMNFICWNILNYFCHVSRGIFFLTQKVHESDILHFFSHGWDEQIFLTQKSYELGSSRLLLSRLGWNLVFIQSEAHEFGAMSKDLSPKWEASSETSPLSRISPNFVLKELKSSSYNKNVGCSPSVQND